MEPLSQLHSLCELERDVGAFYSPVVSWLSIALIQYVAVVTQEMRCQGAVKQKEGGKKMLGIRLTRLIYGKMLLFSIFISDDILPLDWLKLFLSDRSSVVISHW